jgi:hypothetical protein
MNVEIAIPATLPRASALIVAHQDDSSRIYLVLYDDDRQPMAAICMGPETALTVAEELNAESRKAIQFQLGRFC